ncbi:orotidine-5'-phosphate decarboxylase [Enhydrobacter aerosaccus]|uniref:Orotidine 5'-phosphate decarboxylase n=1 Tax=Enhydrobacter aerosaccus TaxID=225324 RepID=A0A1T4SVN4_9HYPH|nr:orotidine-5'-phosphate decarboxylase [Enhydrobacter aerosaccus]SKA32237.1 orotidine-5'-phosphate decarboxylase [Enhydrobacter aerosaccus]
MQKRPNPVYCAIDTVDLPLAARLIRSVAGSATPTVGGIKLGLEFFLAHGAPGVRYAFPAPVRATGTGFFLDLKLHDIPNTVAGGIRAVMELEPTYITIHTAGGAAMMKAAAETAAAEAARLGISRPKLLGVTVLTSLDKSDLEAVGVPSDPGQQVLRLAALARASGLDGVICSPLEIAALRRECGGDFVLMVPGIRPAGAATGDQKRVLTPAEAVALGATHLVIGRPITEAADPAVAAQAIARDLGAL